ncbi:MAG: ester cyclase [Crocosphaera sp.]
MSSHPHVELYGRFAEIFNERTYDQLDEIMTHDFTDYHPGLVDVTSLEVYKTNLAAVIDALEMKAEPEQVEAKEDKVFTRIKLTGRHVGDFFGIAPTGKNVIWYTHELWRVADGKFVERWAVDDIYGLIAQLGVSLPSWGDV